MTDRKERNCLWHLQDTRKETLPKDIEIHTIVIDANDNEFCMIDYPVSKSNKEWTNENTAQFIRQCQPILNAMGVFGSVTIKGIQLPKQVVSI